MRNLILRSKKKSNILDNGEHKWREMFKKEPRNILRQPKVFNPDNLANKPRSNSRPLIVKLFKWFLLILVIISIIYLLFYSPLFIIKNIIVDKDLPASINEHLESIKGKNIFLIKSSKIKEDVLKTFPELTEISIIRGLPDSIKITYSERNPKMIWQSAGRYFLVDEAGIIFREIQGAADLPLVKDNNDLPVNIGSQVVSLNFINFAGEGRSKLKDIMELDHFEVNETTFQLDAIMTNGLKLKFDTTRSIDSQLEALKKFLSDHPNEAEVYIDLRVEGKVFYQ